MIQKRWPRPQDTSLQRARAIARSLLQVLHTVAPERGAAMERAALELGENWLSAPVITTDEPLLTLTECAKALGTKTGTLWAWASRGVVPREPDGLFDLAKVQRALAERPARRRAA